MCKVFTQDYTRCGCRKIWQKVCRNHIDYTHKQIDNSPCPDITTHTLSSVEGLRPGTRNHPGPCPQTYVTYVIQTEEERQADIRDASLWAPSASTTSHSGSWLWEGKPKPKTAKVDVAFGMQNQQAPELGQPQVRNSSRKKRKDMVADLKADQMSVDSFDQADYEAWKSRDDGTWKVGS
ncbi:hypothetical protein BP6252_00234 [Coleophoma cylindrospora]|uniref:Uncharacterized protein n=1 Tax=Coleophoma cylindrospora TaxID=1849047 RepID=A0A3D8SPH9_9HELO|nr:hypothetical protein BP6252_00234 [Coleophoma cylindrospora]